MSNRERLLQAIEKQQDLVRDFQYCLHVAGEIEQKLAQLDAHRDLERIKKG